MGTNGGVVPFELQIGGIAELGDAGTQLLRFIAPTFAGTVAVKSPGVVDSNCPEALNTIEAVKGNAPWSTPATILVAGAAGLRPSIRTFMSQAFDPVFTKN